MHERAQDAMTYVRHMAVLTCSLNSPVTQLGMK